MVEQENSLRLFRDYVGQSLWDANSALYAFGKTDYDRKQYVELAHPETEGKKMSAAEIKEHVLDLLR